MIHARIQESLSGRGGGGGASRSIWHIKKLTTFFLFSPQLILQKSGRTFQRKLSFAKVRVGWNVFQGGGSNFFQGLKLIFLYRNPYNLWFSRVSGPPATPSGSAHVILRIVV